MFFSRNFFSVVQLSGRQAPVQPSKLTALHLLQASKYCSQATSFGIDRPVFIFDPRFGNVFFVCGTRHFVRTDRSSVYPETACGFEPYVKNEATSCSGTSHLRDVRGSD